MPDITMSCRQCIAHLSIICVRVARVAAEPDLDGRARADLYAANVEMAAHYREAHIRNPETKVIPCPNLSR